MSVSDKIYRSGSPKLALGLIASLLLLSAAAFGYNQTVRRSSAEVFVQALQAGLTTEGVSCTIHDEQQGRKSNQTVSLDLKEQFRSTTITTIEQNGVAVTTEGVNTKAREFIRYTAIKASLEDPAAKAPDFSSVLNVWGQQAVADPSTSLYGQTALGGCIIPLANLSQSESRPYIEALQKGEIFKPNTDRPKDVAVAGKKLKQYDITVQPAPYITFMKRLAKQRGLSDLVEVDTAEYASRPPERLVFLIDPNTEQVAAITYRAKNRRIEFTGYGTRPNISEPPQTIPATELQKRLQAIR